MEGKHASIEDLFVALSVLESGLFREPTAGIEFAHGLQAGLLPDGISISPVSLYRELLSTGKAIFAELEERLRRVLCEGNRPRGATSSVGIPAVKGISELIAQSLGLPPGVATVVADICLRIGLERFCSTGDAESHPA